MYRCDTIPALGPSIKYITLFLANSDPLLPLSHFVTHPGTPKVRNTSRNPQIFSRPSTKSRTKVPFTNSLSVVHGVFCQGVFCLEGFVRSGFCPFPFPSEYICDNRQLGPKHQVKFHVSYV